MKRGLTVALVVSLSFMARGQERTVVPVQDGTLTTPSGVSLTVDGGAYLDGPALLSTSQELARLRAENDQLKEAPPPTSMGLLMAFVVGLGVGAGLAFYVLKK